MKIDGDKIFFSSGRRADANCGIIGLSEDLVLYDGYDGGLDYHYESTGPDGPDELTREDKLELADHMIERWQRFRESVLKK